MGRSFDRGGQSRKERMRGKRRAYQQAERDKEAREAVRMAKRSQQIADVTMGATRRRPPVTAQITVAASNSTAASATSAAPQKRSGFFTRAFSRLFGKAA
ncbi:MAG: hypothetical protein P8Y67_04390 [Alphaproteobacteria bacterium]